MLKCKNLFCWRVTYLYVVWSAYVFFLINCYSDNVYTLVFKVAQLWWHFCNAVYHLQSLASYRIKKWPTAILFRSSKLVAQKLHNGPIDEHGKELCMNWYVGKDISSSCMQSLKHSKTLPFWIPLYFL